MPQRSQLSAAAENGAHTSAVVQRACSCSSDTASGDHCAACAARERLGIQPKLTIGAPNDVYEQEADRVAASVVSTPAPAVAARLAVTPLVQRMEADSEDEEYTLQMKAGASPSGLSISTSSSSESAANHAANAVASGGHPLPRSERAFFEPRFGRDLSNVRLHTGSTAQVAARNINAKAYTLRNNIAFATGQYAPNTTQGRRLLAHELTHTLQQETSGLSGGRQVNRAPSGHIQRQNYRTVRARNGEAARYRGNGSDNRAREELDWLQGLHPLRTYRVIQENGGEVYAVQVEINSRYREQRQQRCGRDDTRVSGWPRTTYIDRINVDTGNMTSGMTIHWTRQTAETRALPSTFPISPGAGLCNKCCNRRGDSNEVDSLCTPIGTKTLTDRGTGNRCALNDTDWAHNAAYFDYPRRIAIHSGPLGNMPPLPNYPASHGCVRTSPIGSAIIHDNCNTGHTQVTVNSNWNTPICYPSLRQEKRNRLPAERCGRSAGSATTSNDETETRLASVNSGEEQPKDGAGPIV